MLGNLFFLPMQTLKRQAAKGPTGQEFKDVMRRFKKTAEEINEEHGLGEPVYSFDNAPIHDMTLLESIGIDGSDRAPLPARSPDMHKVIEHVFGTLEGAMQQELHDDPGLCTAKQYKAVLQRLFKSKITAESVRKDIKSLAGTYNVIRKSRDEGGVEGGWPPSRYR